MPHSFFITANDFVNPTARGGVQWCTQDYLRTLEAAGLQSEVLGFDSDQRLLTKLFRKLNPRPFRYQIPPSFVESVIGRIKVQPSVVFLNNTSALSIAPVLRERMGGDVKLVFLSHGAENTDLINALRMDPALLEPAMRKPIWLGRLMFEEIRQRQAIDLAVCISEQDVLFEQWLGAKNTLFLPRTIAPQPITPKCVRGRIGTVATLNHGPNLDGIEQLALGLKNYPEVRLRVVGGPSEVGSQLQERFEAIEYVGRLGDQELLDEASTWCGFANPIFCQARGASTKVATALGWGMPVLTTLVGSRGYVWDDTLTPRPQNCAGLAQLCATVSLGDSAQWWQKAKELSLLAPSFEKCGNLLLEALNQIDDQK